MPKQEGQKSKLVTLLRILEQRTDENHRLNVPQLVQLLENQGILAERKSIYSDIDTLRSLGYDMMRSRGAAGSAMRRRLWLKMAFSSVLRARRPLPAVRLSSA